MNADTVALLLIFSKYVFLPLGDKVDEEQQRSKSKGPTSRYHKSLAYKESM